MKGQVMTAPECLSKDVNLRWKDGFPYDVLAEFGITPFSTIAEIQDAEYSIPGDRSADTRAAVFELERAENRLVVDFFLYLGSVSPQTLDGPNG
jgi:hypothetical protein